MSARMTSPAFVLPGVADALQAINDAVLATGLPAELVELVQLRASELNHCAVCVDGHWRLGRRFGASDEKLFAVGVWRHAPYYSETERIALDVTEELTLLPGRPEALGDDLWERAADAFDADQLAALIVAVGQINSWNRMNHAVHGQAGSWRP